MGLRVVIVGCGKIADGHIEEITKLAGADVVAVADHEPLMAEQIATRYHIPKYYSDFAEMLENEHADVVHITTPPASHTPLTRIALKFGCHVFVEKPLGLNYDEARELIDLVEASQKKLTIGYSYVFDPPAVALRELVQRGVLGDPVHVESYYGYALDGVFARAVLEDKEHWVHKLPGSILQNNIDHALNKITEFIPDETPAVHAVGYKRRSESFGDVRDEFVDELRAMIIGQKTSAYVTFSSHGKPAGQFLRLYGTKRVAHVDYMSRTIAIEDSSKLPSAIGRLVPAFSQSWQYFREGWKNVYKFARSDFHYFAGLNRLISLFYDSITAGTDPPIAYREILRVAWLMDRIIEETTRSQPDMKK